MKRIIKTNFSAMDTWSENKGYKNTKPGLTIEGLSEPMETILKRFQRGQVVLGQKIYYDSEVNPDFESDPIFKASEFDLSDIDKTREIIDEGKKKLETLNDSIAKIKREEYEKGLVDKELARRAEEAENQGETIKENSKS